MKQNYVFEYLNENDFKIKERTIRKYNMLAYKKLVFDYYLKLKSGNFLGKILEENKQEKTEAEKTAETIGKTLAGSNEVTKTVVDSYL